MAVARRFRLCRFRSLLKKLALAAAVTTFTAAALHITGANAVDAQVTSNGPITRLRVSPTLDCGVSWVEDDQPLFFADSACGTFVTDGTTLWGPSATPGSEGFIGTVAPFTPVSQTVTGDGKPATPFVITTVVDAGPMRVTQTDLYTRGDKFISTAINVANNGGAALTPIVYRAADCTLQGSDNGFARVDAVTGSAGCENVAQTRAVWFDPDFAAHRLATASNSLWAAVGSKTEFNDACTCGAVIDNAIGLDWKLSLPAGEATSVALRTNVESTTFVPNVAPVFVAPTPANGGVVNVATGAVKTISFKATDADAGDVITVTPSVPSALVGAQATVTNGNPASGTLQVRAPVAGDYVITLKATDADHETTTSFTLRATGKAPTSLTAYPATLALPPVGPRGVVYLTLSATLTSFGNPVAGKTIYFRGANGQEFCRAVTDANGYADCQSAISAVQALLNFDYTASFGGDNQYLPSKSNGEIIELLGLPLP